MQRNDDAWVTTSTLLRDLRDFERGAAWQRLSGRFRGPIIAFAQRMGLSVPDAEDVAQETLLAFASAYREGRYDETRGRLSDWLFGIAYRQAARGRRLRGRRETPVGDAPEAESPATVPDRGAASQIWEREWQAVLLQRCMEQVAREVEPQTYEIFELCAQHGLPAREVAERLGVRETTVYNVKHRVARRLRELLAELEEIDDESSENAGSG